MNGSLYCEHNKVILMTQHLTVMLLHQFYTLYAVLSSYYENIMILKITLKKNKTKLKIKKKISMDNTDNFSVSFSVIVRN